MDELQLAPHELLRLDYQIAINFFNMSDYGCFGGERPVKLITYGAIISEGSGRVSILSYQTKFNRPITTASYVNRMLITHSLYGDTSITRELVPQSDKDDPHVGA